MTGTFDGQLLIDTHAHFYAEFEPESYFDAAYENLSAGAGATAPEAHLPTLFITATSWEPGFRRLREISQGDMPGMGRWAVHPTEESTSVLIESGDRRLLAVAGAQVATAEGLEVLFLGINWRVSDGTPIREAVEAGLEAGALCVLPWSPGKWWFNRGRIIRKLIDDYASQGLRLGDTAQRPAMSFTPAHFSYGKARGVPVLPGTDPLPFPKQARRAGSLALRVRASGIDLDRPAAPLLALLRGGEMAARTVGHRESPLAFASNQIRMQIRRRART